MPISFNVDLTGRRKRQEAQLEREREQQAVEAMTNQFLGAPQAGPPTAGGLLSRFEGMIPAGAQSDLLETQLMSGVPGFQQAGLQSAQDLLEQQRQQQLAQVKQDQLQQALTSPAIQATPEGRALAALIGAGAGKDVTGVFKDQFAPFTLGTGQQRFSGTGEEIAIGPEKAEDLEAKRAKLWADATGLRKEFTTVTKPFDLQNQAYGRVIASAQDPSAAGDLALIFNYMKVLDPGSTVREGEFATAAAAAGIPERVIAQYNRVKTGERLSSVQRKDFVDRAGRLFEQAAKQHGKTADIFSNMAKRQGLDPRDVAFQRQTVDVLKSPVTPPPPPGFVEER